MSILEIELTPEMEQRLRERARRHGVEAKAYVQTVVMRDLSQEENAAASDGERRFNVMDFYGAGRDAWKGVDVQQYINEMRDEWDA
jgi:predicted DNA-binding protein